MRVRLGSLVALALLIGASPSFAQTPNDSPSVLQLLPADAVSEKRIVINGNPLAYTVTAGTLPLWP